MLPQKLGVKLREKAEESGYLPEEFGVELIRRGLNEELDPEELLEHYWVLSEKYLAEARELLKEDVDEVIWKMEGEFIYYNKIGIGRGGWNEE
jgi:hypothetical protein